jgi:hypothetical protein
VEVEGTAGNYHTAGNPIQVWEGVSTSAGWVLEAESDWVKQEWHWEDEMYVTQGTPAIMDSYTFPVYAEFWMNVCRNQKTNTTVVFGIRSVFVVYGEFDFTKPILLGHTGDEISGVVFTTGTVLGQYAPLQMPRYIDYFAEGYSSFPTGTGYAKSSGVVGITTFEAPPRAFNFVLDIVV